MPRKCGGGGSQRLCITGEWGGGVTVSTQVGPQGIVPISNLSNTFQMDLNWFDQKKAFHCSKNRNKIYICRELNKEQLFILELFQIQNRIWIKHLSKLLGFEIQSNLLEFDLETQDLVKFEQVALDCARMADQLTNRSLGFQICEFIDLLREFDLNFDFGYLESD
jgi:hypothetical protein